MTNDTSIRHNCDAKCRSRSTGIGSCKYPTRSLTKCSKYENLAFNHHAAMSRQTIPISNEFSLVLISPIIKKVAFRVNRLPGLMRRSNATFWNYFLELRCLAAPRALPLLLSINLVYSITINSRAEWAWDLFREHPQNRNCWSSRGLITRGT